MATKADYEGREQSLVKHYILQRYLERFAHIIGQTWNTLTYVDCFSGPWEAKTDDLSDTSFAIALEELRKARETLSARKDVRIRAMFLEQDRGAYARLSEYCRKQTDIEARQGAFLDSIAAVQQFVRTGGATSFPFIFVDPTGWTGFDLEKIGPLLRFQPGEVLINFMTEHIRRFVTPNEEREEIIDSFRRLFGTEVVFDQIAALTDPQEREDKLFMTYAQRVREVGEYQFACPAVVLHPMRERAYFHLIYATRHRKGVEVFKQVEKDAFSVQERVRAEALETEQLRKTGQGSLFSEDEKKEPSHRAVALRERYLGEAIAQIESLRPRKRVHYAEVWDAALAFPLVWESDVKAWIDEQQKKNRIRLHGLKPRQRVPKWSAAHEVEFLG